MLGDPHSTGPGADCALLGPVWVTAWFSTARGALPACGQPARNVYPAKPAAATSARPSTTAQLRRRRPGASAGVSSSSRLTADSTPGPRLTASYSAINGPGSAPRALAMARMCPRA
jgi:hypothetical protein